MEIAIFVGMVCASFYFIDRGLKKEREWRKNNPPNCKECKDYGSYASCGGCSECGLESPEER